MSTSVATSTITVVPKPRAPELVIHLPSLIPKDLAGRVPNSAMEYYDGVDAVTTRVPLWPTAPTLAACGNLDWSERGGAVQVEFSLSIA
jgi:hypothetical protein